MKIISSTIAYQTPKLWAGTWGPVVDESGCRFRLWAKPGAKIELVLEGDRSGNSRIVAMLPQPSGMYEAYVKKVGEGTRYWFRIDGAGPFPDPASRYQPLGVHGPSQLLGSDKFSWDADKFQPPSLREIVIYELHVGTFTLGGTFLAAIDKLDDLQQLGVTAIELMPIADFAGERNWGYDGVSLYAPAHSYGTPDDLRQLVLEAHRRGLAVILDVVYNHLGPDGAYHSTFAPQFYSGKHRTPWGDGLNFDGEGKEKVRAYFIESALMWIHDYHVDGLRCDAIDTIQDDSQPHFLAELTARVHAAGCETGKQILMIAEDARNERKVVLPPEQGGYGFDVVWSDDFHHEIRHRLAGDSDGYYRDFSGTMKDIATTIQNGWFFTGQLAKHWNRPRGTSSDGLSLESRLFCIQNHDQVGNRAFGDRLSTQISCAAFFAASALLLLSPEIPLIFMGQEWAAPQPFLFFTNHHEDLGRLVTEGRRKEFEHFSAFRDEANRERIPDPQALQTFLDSKLDWNMQNEPVNSACLRWYTKLLEIRKMLLQAAQFRVSRALNAKTILMQWESEAGNRLAVVALEGPTKVSDSEWENLRCALTSEDREFSIDPKPIAWDPRKGELIFQRPGAAIFAAGKVAPGLTGTRQ